VNTSSAQPLNLRPLVVYGAVVLILVASMIALSALLGERHKERATGEPYELGVVSTGWARLRFSANFYLIAIDHFLHATTAQADVVLPAGTFAESDGTLVNNEGWAQRFFQVFVPRGDVQESWRWSWDVIVARGQDEIGIWPGAQ
jgi:NADH dehydrogenase/NADH:ubiquinone oxidoreductase subunit G